MKYIIIARDNSAILGVWGPYNDRTRAILDKQTFKDYVRSLELVVHAIHDSREMAIDLQDLV